MRHAHAPRSADTQHVLLQHRRMIRHALLRGLRRQGRRGAAAGPACLAAGNGDFRDKQNRLLAEIGYQTTFRPGYATSNGAYESGLVAGAKVVSAPLPQLELCRSSAVRAPAPPLLPPSASRCCRARACRFVSSGCTAHFRTAPTAAVVGGRQHAAAQAAGHPEVGGRSALAHSHSQEAGRHGGGAEIAGNRAVAGTE